MPVALSVSERQFDTEAGAMRVGIVSQAYYPRYGGITEHVHHTAVELRRRGHEVTIITSRFRDGQETNHSEGVERVGYNLLVPFNRAFVDLTIGLTLRQQLRRLFRAHDFEVLHTHCPNAPSLPILAVQEATCAQVGTFHAMAGRGLLQDAFQRYLAATVSRLDARIAVSETAEASTRLYYPGHYHVIPNGVDVERFHPRLEPLGQWSDPGRVNLLFVGRLDPRKGLQYLLGAMPEVVERTRGRARLLIVGDSYLRPRFEAQVPSAMRAFVHFAGHVPSGDLPRWYATGDIFVSPASGNESFGIVLLEAMAAGRAVVASDIPGYHSVVNPDENGVLFEPGNVRALARTLAALVDDPARRAALAERGRARALQFAWPRVTEQIEALYREVVGRRSEVTETV
jgi:phosphatidylinositol alpha-mannosyltransferase